MSRDLPKVSFAKGPETRVLEGNGEVDGGHGDFNTEYTEFAENAVKKGPTFCRKR